MYMHIFLLILDTAPSSLLLSPPPSRSSQMKLNAHTKTHRRTRARTHTHMRDKIYDSDRTSSVPRSNSASDRNRSSGASRRARPTAAGSSVATTTVVSP